MALSAGPILVTGGNGFVGGALAAELASRGREVRASVRRRPQAPFAGVDYVETGDIENEVDWSAALAGIDTVVHTAARAHIVRDDAPDLNARYMAANRDAVLRLAHQGAAARVRRLVFLSSIHVNGSETHGRPFRPDDTPRPASAYARAKQEAEAGLRAIAGDTELEIVIVRPPLVLGPGAKGNLSTLARAIERGLPLPLGAVSRNRRDLVSLNMLVELLILAADHPAAAGETLLVSDGTPLSTRALVERIAAMAGRRARLLPLPPALLRWALRLAGRPEMASQLLGDLEVDISHTRALLGFDPGPAFELARGRSLR